MPRKELMGVDVYFLSSLVELFPSLINSMYCISDFEDDVDWSFEKIDRVCAYPTDDHVKSWVKISSKFLTLTNQVLYKLVCSNWIPTISYTAMN
ncbi:hypothetical protein F2Q69_00034760 [Brassica cretica]|uniref:Uncharacterized protein n=1 Tax=Brassica cretica TaxID=69181 RepID=A0A8S9SU60_BRACR|nr:hypothetical protein F2Q69_00034760 [Brassica cretica]